jgi:hypothetical protein
MKRATLIAWTVLRLPMLALVLYLARFSLLDLWEQTLGLEHTAAYAVYLLSTFQTRILLYLGGAAALGIILMASTRLAQNDKGGYVLRVAGVFLLVLVSSAYLLIVSNALPRALIVAALFALNALPVGWLSNRTGSTKGIGAFLLAGAGLVEAVIPQIYFHWLGDRLQIEKRWMKFSPLAGVLVAPLFWIFILTPVDNQRIISLGSRLHPEPAVEKFADGDYNWIEFNPARRELYVVGLDTNFILAHDADNLDAPPRRSKTPIDKSQSFAFNPERQEIYIYNNISRELLYFDAVELKVLRVVQLPGMATGDVWIAWNRLTDAIIISSETDRTDGESFIMLDRESGETLATLSPPLIPTAFILFHPNEPVLYFNSFRDTYLVAWNMREYKFDVETKTQPRTDRMAYIPHNDEIMVASSLEGAVLRYDAASLEFRGKIKTSPGDRTLAFDPKRNLLLTGNFIDNRVRVVDLNTHEIVETYYLGPWIRTITLDTENGVAYVSSIRGLFKLTYAQP